MQESIEATIITLIKKAVPKLVSEINDGKKKPFFLTAVFNALIDLDKLHGDTAALQGLYQEKLPKDFHEVLGTLDKEIAIYQHPWLKNLINLVERQNIEVSNNTRKPGP